MYGVAGKIAVVSGGAAGIGRAIAERLAREGCHIGIVDLCAGVRPLPPAVTKAGVTDWWKRDPEEVLATCVARYGVCC
jgi:NAD(P)-dependent dehydrogenase (short-subunit alcohol dehydrogenase family)